MIGVLEFGLLVPVVSRKTFGHFDIDFDNSRTLVEIKHFGTAQSHSRKKRITDVVSNWSVQR